LRWLISSVAEPEPRAKETKVNCLPDPEAKLRLQLRLLLFIKDLKKFYKKIMVAEEFFVIFSNFLIL
jgi:hypothetical protein